MRNPNMEPQNIQVGTIYKDTTLAILERRCLISPFNDNYMYKHPNSNRLDGEVRTGHLELSKPMTSGVDQEQSIRYGLSPHFYSDYEFRKV